MRKLRTFCCSQVGRDSDKKGGDEWGFKNLKLEIKRKELQGGIYYSFESNIVEQDEVNGVKQMWEQVKEAVVDSEEKDE